jgi:poly(A) polymerase
VLIPHSVHGLQPRQFSANAIKIVERLQALGFEACIVGGSVRDLLLGHHPKDFDVATNATPEQIKEAFRNARLIGRRFRLAHVRFGREIIEVATYRGESGEDDTSEPNPSGIREMEQGRLVRDNVFGSEAEDARRRDFTVNALMYDPATETIKDYVGGYEDLKARRLELIGDPETRYTEDPVRLLRAVRFKTKLGLELAPKTAEPIQTMAPLLQDIPPARLFDEILKLFLGGQAWSTYQSLVDFNLWDQLFPSLFSNPSAPPPLVELALKNTDTRVREDQPVTPGFLFAVFLWARVEARSETLIRQGYPPVNALGQAADEVLAQQAQTVSIHRRFSSMAREIWCMQPRFMKKNRRRAERLVNERRFRAAYDFLLLRVAQEPELSEIANWWTALQEDIPTQSAAHPASSPGSRSKKRRPRRRRRPSQPASSSS